MTAQEHQQHQARRRSIEQIFLACLLVSFLLHTSAGLFVTNIELPPPASQADYTEWVKRVAAPPEVAKEPEPEEETPEEKKEEPEEEEEVAEETRKQAKPSGPPSKAQEERREQVREAVKSVGILGIIGSASEDGDLANVFDSSSSAVNQNLAEALDSQSDLSASSRDFRKRGDGKVGDIGDVEVGGGGKVGGGGRRAAAVPKAFVKSSDAKSFGGNANMRMLKRYMRKIQNKVETCYNIARKSNRNLKGDLTAQWTIMPDGRASNVRILKDTLSSSSVRSCLTTALEKTVYRGVVKGTAPVVVQQSFNFGSTG
ncbi:MAG: AgmX/PglI C-terminal domain-containing protein [Myxococcota bacterium]